MLIKDIVGGLEKSKEFCDWDKAGYYLVHLFKMSDHPWQVGYYSSQSNKIISFELREQPVQQPESEVFKEDKRPLLALELDKLQVDFDDAFDSARQLAFERFPHETIDREIVILQRGESGQVYNITFITKAYRMLNVKVNAESRDVVSYELRSLMDIGEKYDGESGRQD